MRTDPTALKDADPAPWKGRKRPDPTPQESAVILAARRFTRLDDAVREHEGPRSGSRYEALVREWREAHTELLAAARVLPGDAA